MSQPSPSSSAPSTPADPARWLRLPCAFVLLVGALVSSCGARVASDEKGGDDSSTHWLSRCERDADCGELVCLCGVCSEGCEGAAACEAFGNAAVCSERAGCADAAGLCTRGCEADRDCASGLCSGEVCVGDSAPESSPAPSEPSEATSDDDEVPAEPALPTTPSEEPAAPAPSGGGGSPSLPSSDVGGSGGSALGGSPSVDGCREAEVPSETRPLPSDLAGVPWEGTLSIDLTACEPVRHSAALPFGSAWVAVAGNTETCELWLGGETEDPSYDGSPTQYCRFPRPGCVTEANIEVGMGGPARLASPACIPWVAPPVEVEVLTVDTLCASLDDWFGQSIEVDLGSRVETRRISTAIGCDQEAACCNWEWTAYVVPCPEGDLVLTGESAPYGSVTLPESEFTGPGQVTMGCQGMECDPICIPEDTASIGRVRARLEPATDGYVLPGEQFEEFAALAELAIEADLTPTSEPEPDSEPDACLSLETDYLAEWSQLRSCMGDEQCTSEYSGLCTVSFADGTTFGCQLPFAAGGDLALLHTMEGQYRNDCSFGADCDCAAVPSACALGQCDLLFEPRSEGDLERCDAVANACDVVPYDHCCGSTKRAINSAYLSVYAAHPEWQSFDACSPTTGQCAPDAQLTAARCNIEAGATVGRCELTAVSVR